MGFNHLPYKAVGRSLGVSVISLCMAYAPATAEELQNWSFDQATNELTFSLPDTILPEFFLLAEPPRLVLDIPDTEVGDIEPEQIYGATVQTIRVAQHTEEQVRVVIELTPDIVLAPEQADIQFDDRDGQRHWRFRPLIASHTVSVDAATRAKAPNLQDSISHSAANLAISEQSSEAILPIDPYDADTGSQIVSVPPLEDTPDLTADITVTESAVPEVPPMIVPSLKEETATETTSLEAANVIDSEIVRDGNLPELATNISPQRSQVDQPLPVEPAADIPDTTDQVELTQSVAETTTEELEVELTQSVAENTAEELENETATVAISPESTEEAPVSVAIESPVQEPVGNDLIPATNPVETALAPVENDSAADANPVDPVPPSSTRETVQQPAAERTIVQTTMPAPLTFGQPLPASNR